MHLKQKIFVPNVPSFSYFLQVLEEHSVVVSRRIEGHVMQVGVTVDFFGIRRPQRVMDLFVADGRPWHLITRALNASFVADGELTLVLERRNAYF